jgi:hypothetical protein
MPKPGSHGRATVWRESEGFGGDGLSDDSQPHGGRSVGRQPPFAARGEACRTHAVARALLNTGTAMAGVRGAGGQPLGTVINFYEINYSFYADQMNKQFQNIDIRNNAPNANINVQGDQGARNDGRLI